MHIKSGTGLVIVPIRDDVKHLSEHGKLHIHYSARMVHQLSVVEVAGDWIQ